MGLISDEDLERVRRSSDLVAIASERMVVKQAGRKFKGCCPFHDEKTPSFQIDPELGLWHCFGCGEGGDVFDFVQRMDNLDFPDAVRLLAQRANVEITETSGKNGISHPRGHKERLKACCAEAAEFYHYNLMRSADPAAAAARDYLAGRDFGSDVCRRWQLGFAPGRGLLVKHLVKKGFTNDEIVEANLAYKNEKGQVRDRFFNRVMFPIRDKIGSTIAFGGRVIGAGEPKYLNSSETLIFHKSSQVFGIDFAKNSITNEACAIVVEGYTDVITLHEAGVTNAVATLGTALTLQHVKMLRSMRPKKIVYLFDGDNAGQKAADRAVEFIDWGITPESGSSYIEFLVTVLPENQDPAEFCAKEGKAGVDKAIAGAAPLIRFAIDRRLEAWDLTSPEQRGSAIASAVSLLAPVKDSIIASDYVNYIADRLGCEYHIVRRALQTTISHTNFPASTTRLEQADVPVPQKKETEIERIERECLSLMAKNPRAVKFLIKTKDKFDWSGEWVARLVDAFCEMYDENIAPAVLVSAVDDRVEGAASYLAAGTIEVGGDEQVVATVLALLSDLKENDLLQKIRLGNAALKNPAQLTSEEYDETFERISTLQKELNELRIARTGHNRP